MTLLPTPLDPRLGRHMYFDKRSKNYPIREILPVKADKKPRSYSWACTTYLDQGQEGSCVGHAWAHDLLARPAALKNVTHNKAVKIYKTAQTLDEWPGEGYEGTSVLAGAKATMQLYVRSMDSYRWAFNLDDLVATLGYFGPVILGINWYVSMYTPDINGVITISGGIAGGHAILATAVDVKRRRIRLHNSWGTSFGKGGDLIVPYNEMERLISEGADMCVPIGRHNIIMPVD